MSETRALVDHFFRHESGRLVALLTRWLGVSRLDLAEDVVQAALMRALQVWSRRGIPEDPAGWLYRTARNLAIDAIRRERTQARVLNEVGSGEGLDEAEGVHERVDDEIGDEPLRLLFVCCHETVPVEARVSLALKTLCGFSVGEIARALLCSEASVEKRISRAKARLREEGVSFEPPGEAKLQERLDSVMAVIYLLFNEGYHSSHADVPIRRELCSEARRLATMLANHPVGDVPAVSALLGLICFHSARMGARVASGGGVVLLDEQDRLTWDWGDVREGMRWMARSAQGEELTRYHIEAAIAWEHCRAGTFEGTDWRRIIGLYEALERVAPAPTHVLNRAVAVACLEGPEAGLEIMAGVPAEAVPASYPVWHAVVGELRFRAGKYGEAEAAWMKALELCRSSSDREHLRRRLAECRRYLRSKGAG